uniref:Peroxisomal membrane protein PEX14-like KPWE domain-containing protein n=1 Tax=Seriola lalandi dorsalis TaxID=1841481 RepID=A0A3B4XL31_SERLL
MDCSVEQLDQATPSDSDSDVSKNQGAETSAETEVKQLSFAEVMRLIQEGREVPGTIKLDIKPSNQSPTPSQMERVLKPWEIGQDTQLRFYSISQCCSTTELQLF